MSTEGLLTPDELDALMEAAAGGRAGAGGGDAADVVVLPYDLASPENALAGILPALTTVQQRLLHRLATGFHELLRREVAFSTGEVHVQVCQDFASSLRAPCSTHVIGLAPLIGPGLLVFDQPLVFALVGAYFGGQGAIYSPNGRRDFTAAESRMIQRLLGLFSRALLTAWKPFLSLAFAVAATESNPHFVTALNPAEPLIVTTFETEVDGTRGAIHLALPCAMFETVRAQLIATLAREHPRHDERLAQRLRDGLQASRIEARAVLGEVGLSLRELMALRVGDVVPCDVPAEARLEIEGVPVLSGPFGVAKGWRSLRVERWLLDLAAATDPATDRGLRP